MPPDVDEVAAGRRGLKRAAVEIEVARGAAVILDGGYGKRAPVEVQSAGCRLIEPL